MATTFEVLYLGTAPEIDTVEDNTVSEADASLLGMTFGSPSNPLAFGGQRMFSPVDYSGADADRYNIDNSEDNDTFSIDGGPAQTFDGLAVYNATVSYVDGTPDASITAVVFQDTAGNLYLAPESSANADFTAMTAAPIESLTLNSVVTISKGNLLADRQFTDFLCFAGGTRILTECGEVPVERLRVGDRVVTLDAGPQPIRWIGSQRVAARGAMAPIRFDAGAVGNARELLLSPQHRILLGGWQAELMFGEREVLVPACAMVNDRSIRRRCGGTVSYRHMLFDRHQIVFSEGAATESLYPGRVALGTVSETSREEIFAIFPELRSIEGRGNTARRCLKRHEATLVAEAVGELHGAAPGN